MLTVNVFAADTDAEARRHFLRLQQAFLNLRRGRPGQVPPPSTISKASGLAAERAGVEHALSCSFVGAARYSTSKRPSRILWRTRSRDRELMVAGHFHDHAPRGCALLGNHRAGARPDSTKAAERLAHDQASSRGCRVWHRSAGIRR